MARHGRCNVGTSCRIRASTNVRPQNGWPYLVCLVIGVVIWHAASRIAFQVHVRLPVAEPPRRPVLFINPWSGGGKAAKVNLAEEAATRGIRTVELHRGDDLVQLVHDAVAAGADALAAAGGDGTQAIVAAAEHELPFACIPAGTRNHFALDLGVDRDDVVGALDAFIDGGEQVVDLGEVNGRVFVNNVSLGLYAEAVQSKGYRDAKIRTLNLSAVARPAVGLPGRHGPPVGSDYPGVQQPLPARPCRRIRDPAPDRRRPARRIRRPDQGERRRTTPRDEPPPPAVIDHHVRDQLDAAGAAGYRWRGGRARPAGEIPDTSGHAARTHLAQAPRCVTVGDGARSRR